MKTKREIRAEWISKNSTEMETASKKHTCPAGCRAQCGNGATCATQSDGGWGYWVQAFKMADVDCSPRNYWSGSAPTPSTSINKGIAEYISESIGFYYPQKED